MSKVFVSGLGAVSPAGWGVTALREAMEKGEPLPAQPLERPGWTEPLRVRFVPSPATRPPFLAHPRLRRTTPITHYGAAAMLEALSGPMTNPGHNHRLGIIVCLQSGCIQFSFRFFDELLKDPATASPLAFPETVFAAPASHVAALIENTPLVHTLTGDPASFLQGVALAAQWLDADQVDLGVVIGADEIHWMLADALWHFDRRAILSSGAGAICLTLDPLLSIGVELAAITDAHTYANRANRTRAAHDMRQQLLGGGPQDLLCDGTMDHLPIDAAEEAAWRDWISPRLSPKRILGEGLMAASAWQCVAACDAVARGRFAAANVSLVGCNQQALGARFIHSDELHPAGR